MNEDPFAAAEHRAELGGSASGPRAERWAAYVQQVDLFFWTFRRMPRASSSGPSGARNETALHAWVTRQRKNESRLSEFQFLRLDSIPGFSWSPREDQWALVFGETQIFLVTFERQPRRRSADSHERKLAGWIRSQNTQIVKDRMRQNRVQTVRQWRDALPHPARQTWLSAEALRIIDGIGRGLDR